MKRVYLLATVLFIAPLAAMKLDPEYEKQMRLRREQIQRYQELQNAARPAAQPRTQPAPRAPRMAQQELDAQHARALQKQMDEQLARELHQQDDERLARELHNQEIAQETKAKQQAQIADRQRRLERERAEKLFAQEQLRADEETARQLQRQLQEQASLTLARQLQQEAEADYAAFIQYQEQEDQLEQRRRELEERFQREQQLEQRRQEPLDGARDRQPRPVAPRPVAPRPTPVVPQQRPGGRVIAPCVFGEDLLRLPGLTGGGLRIQGVYHVYSRAEVPEDKDWSCGFHAIYNAVKLERRICNRQIDDRAFIQACQAIAPRNLHGFSDLNQGLKIAKRLGIPHAYNLMHERGRSELILDYSDDDSGEDIPEGQFWQNLRQALNQARGPLCIHFDCHIESHSIQNPGEHEGHAVLITVARMAHGATAIYIFDNVNEDENHISQAQIRAHVELIYRNLLG